MERKRIISEKDSKRIDDIQTSMSNVAAAATGAPT